MQRSLRFRMHLIKDPNISIPARNDSAAGGDINVNNSSFLADRPHKDSGQLFY